jgi:dihydrofolate reductase
MTPQPIISIIAAVAENSVIGKDNKLLWHIPDDLKRFKKITLGHPIIMGRKTFESIRRPLPGRLNIIISRNSEFKIEECVVVSSLEDALKIAAEHDAQEVFIIGGASIYKEAISYAHKLYLTKVHRSFEGDAFFPSYDDFKKVIASEDHQYEGLSYTFIDLVK